MKLARATLTRVRLRLIAPISTARGRIRVREGVVLALESESGEVGYGEALPLEGFGSESVAQACATLEKLARRMLGRILPEPDPPTLNEASAPGRGSAFTASPFPDWAALSGSHFGELGALLDEAESVAPDAPAARAALDSALFDLAARTRGISVAELLAAPRVPRGRVGVSALLRGEQPLEAAREARLAIDEGFRSVKLKVGASDLAHDEARVSAVRGAIGDDVKLRLDANAGWKEADAERAIARFAPHAIEYLEQPVAASDLAGLARLRANSPIRIAADEALAGGRAVDEILQRDAADLLVLKPATLGGLRACLGIAHRARAKGVNCVVTSALDSALGLSAALQLAAALPGPLPDAGLATGASLVEDLAAAPLPIQGEIELPECGGIGVTPLPGALARCALGDARKIGR